MPTRVIDTASAEHYLWGGPSDTDCDGWHLVKTEGLSVIEERMPPGAGEVRHSHTRSRQFFYVLQGDLTLEVEHHEFRIASGQGVEVAPGQAHQAMNRGSAPVRMLVTSQPPSHGDRIPA